MAGQTRLATLSAQTAKSSFLKGIGQREKRKIEWSHFTRNISSETNSSKSFFITTPIFYVNSQPHIGHLYSALLADAAHRFQQLQGKPTQTTIFSTGTDEHGLKVQRAAALNGSDPLRFCNDVSEKFKSLFDSADVKYTHYVRTTEEKHKLAVEHFFGRLRERGHIYRGNYSGWYCVPDEAFLTEAQVQEVTLPSGEKRLVSAESGQPVDWNSEDNYMFELSKFQSDLLYWLNDEKRVQPKRFREQLRRWLDDDLRDLSVSRPSARVSWGIPVPDDDLHTIYVWVDALINYLTVSGYPKLDLWPPDVQVLGKDILRFHGIYWPALLIGAGLEPPRSILCHSHWTVEGQKMSKSLGNVVCPEDCIKRYSADGLRYLLLRMGTPHFDSNWSEANAVHLLNVELADTLGNLLSRCTAPSLNPNRQVLPLNPQFLQEMPLSGQKLVEQLINLPAAVGNHYSDFNFYRGLEVVVAAARRANAFVQEEKPWELKNLPDRTKLDSVLRVALETVRMAGIALQPVVPSVASQILDTLGIPIHQRSWANLQAGFEDPKHRHLSTSFSLGPRKKLFTKIKL
ncbi:methionine--tRNA ligase, mitochondrial-like [Homarus americanus]|uniref:Methionine--tRNA ligase, mitochondrial n=1 Tax=Homarus americanus TaxID=6706 RepID=A0A8J5JF68_HOMAM|nr:methionine--tRNA ligase, mitochondrial-like [Homarus americanus]KAG7154465.1 Methionine--tRNA ligase-like [Homarus americanus]